MKDYSVRSLASLPPNRVKRALARLTAEDIVALQYDWSFWARPEQLPPEGAWDTWVALAGRGFGKTRVGAETTKLEVVKASLSGYPIRIALVAPTAYDCRNTMVEGESGLLSVFPPQSRPLYQPSRRRVLFGNGSVAYLYSAEEPERLRGPQHHFAWCDELCAWKYPQDTWDNLMFGLRLGSHPQALVTTTPKPISTLKSILQLPGTVVVRGSTYDNIANLPDSFIDSIISRYEGTRLGRQELHAEVLEDVEGALWSRAWIEQKRVRTISHKDLQRIVVAIDPAVTATQASDETGIVVAGLGVDGRAYVLDDLSCRLSPDGWASRAVKDGYQKWEADRIIGEANNGGDLIEKMLRTVDAKIPYRKVNASKGKIARAEPIAALYEQGKVSHVGTYAYLEDELCSYTGAAGEASPNRLDALVWALSELMIERAAAPKARWI